jgi:hypothetical protein
MTEGFILQTGSMALGLATLVSLYLVYLLAPRMM